MQLGPQTLPMRGLTANPLSVHDKFFPSNNHFEGQMMQPKTLTLVYRVNLLICPALCN